MLSALGMDVDFITRTKSVNDYSKYNFIINALPLTNETKDYFDKELFGKLNKNTYIINVGRGETINEQHLYEALQKHEIQGAFLDVVKNEPLQKDNKLLTLDTVYISPHIANATKNSLNIQVEAFIKNLEKYKKNKKMENIIQ